MSNPMTPAQLKAEQLAATLAAKLPTSVSFDLIQAGFLAVLKAWKNPADAPVVVEEKA